MTTTAEPVQESAPKYKWDWIEKLNDSPFRREIQRLKRDSKQHPEKKAQNVAFKLQLGAKEKELLVDFQMKCQQAKIWINEANASYADEHSDDPQILQRVALQRKQEKVNTIDQFWAELLCQQQIFIQNTKIAQQATQMAELQKQLNEAQQALRTLNAAKQQQSASTAPASQQNGDQNVVGTASAAPVKKTKKQKKPKDEEREQYQGLVGFFNRPQKPRAEKQTSAIATKAETATETPNENAPQSASKDPLHDFLSFSYVPDHMKRGLDDDSTDDDDAKNKNNDNDAAEAPVAVPTTTTTTTEKEKQKQKKKTKRQKASRSSMKGGFLASGSKGLYDDKKSDADLSVKERNAKNVKQIEEMGLKDAVDSPLFTWERPKQAERAKGNTEAPENRPNDPLTQFLDAQAESANKPATNTDNKPQQ